MSISREEVRRTARLARLDLDPGEAARMAEDLAEILAYAERLPESAEGGAEEERAGRFRPDRPAPGLTAGEALAPAPERDGDFFRVPPAIERE